MRFKYFLILLFSLGLLSALTGCRQEGEDASETAVAPVLAIATLITSTPADESITPEQATVKPKQVTTTPEQVTTAPEQATAVPEQVTVTPLATLAPTGKPTPSLTATTVINEEGALIGVSMQSRVGMLLDEFPVEIRDRVATAVLAQSDDKWLARAARQLRLTRLRLNFRGFIYLDKGQLPLPLPELWQFELDPAGPTRETIQGHDLVMMGYTFTSTLLTDVESPGVAEPDLAEIGGVWDEPFILPADPDLLLQRTSNACINEGGFPPNSFDSENIWYFYDFDCEADSGGAIGCHRTSLPNLSCRQALAARVGEIETALRFERLPWDNRLVAQVRTGPLTSPDTPDLMVVGDDLETNRLIYRYIESDDCAVEEGAVSGSGWRRLLQFDATVYNVGGQALHIGPVVTEDPVNHVFTYNVCHDHFHYSNYGDFFLQNLDQLIGSKQAFCVQSTSRFSNNEASPLTHEYSCRFQGIQAGWVDEYIAGLDAQWIDITGLKTPPEGRAVQLGFRSNGDSFLCEGTPVVDENSELLWEPSGFTTATGESINRPQCQFITDWDTNNEAVREVFVLPAGSFVTAPCTNEEAGPLRNCGFTELQLTNADPNCRPGEPVVLELRTADEGLPQTLRVCEWSAVLGVGVACTYEDSLANAIVGSAVSEIAFTCPRIRDADEENPDGGYALYTAPVWTEDDLSSILLDNGE